MTDLYKIRSDVICNIVLLTSSSIRLFDGIKNVERIFALFFIWIRLGTLDYKVTD